MLPTPSSSALRTTACRAQVHKIAVKPLTSRRVVFPSVYLPTKVSITTFRRDASTSTSSDSSSVTTQAASSSHPKIIHEISTPTEKLPWETFFRMRRLRRRYNRVASVSTALLSTSLAASILGNKEVDVMNTQLFGLDMLTLFGLAIAGSGALGWLAGPMVGGPMFKMLNRRVVGGMAEREKEFFTHIKRNRVDPSAQSYNNPVPDYYGEKIGSLKEYRQWLKDQRAYNKKKSTFLL